MEHNNRKTPEEIDNELSVGNFAKQQAITLGLVFGGVIAGFAAGAAVAKAGAGKFLDKIKIFKNASQDEKDIVVKIAGATMGAMIGGLASNFEHWKKVERERKGVEEINKDVAAIMEKRVEFEDSLGKQSAHIKNLIAEYEKNAGGNMVDKVAAERNSVSQQARGA
ncbi:MAG: hypothetical protein R3D71_09605 [Rickettsiales bacterium]